MAMFENFPYTDMHNLNLDWIIKIAKDFLDQYTHIQQLIEDGEQSLQDLTSDGLQQLQDKADNLESLLQAWYDTHSQDIANQLADALSDLNDWFTEHVDFLDGLVEQELQDFNTRANALADQVIASIPQDYSALSADVAELEAQYNNLSTVIKNLILNKAIDSTNGNEVVSTGIAITGFIPIGANNKFTFKNSTNGYYLFQWICYDKDKTYIGSYTTPNNTMSALSADMYKLYPAAMFVRFNIASLTYITLTDEITAAWRIDVEDNQIFENYDYLKSDFGLISTYKNLAKYAIENGLYKNGYYINSEGVEVEAAGNACTDYISIQYVNEIYSRMVIPGYGVNDQRGALYDADKVFISVIAGTTISRFDTTKASYIRLNLIPADITGIPTTISHTCYETVKEYPWLYVKGTGNKWNGKKITILGDSLTYGSFLPDREKYCFCNLLAQRTGATVINMGMPGSRLADVASDPEDSFIDALSNIPSDSNLIIVYGGINDYWKATRIGNKNDTDVSTFYGAIKYIINYLFQSLSPGRNKDILFMFPNNQDYQGTKTTTNAFNQGTLADYHAAMKEQCEISGIDFLDIYSDAGLNGALYSAVSNLYTIDGAHYNYAGHERIASRILGKILSM